MKLKKTAILYLEGMLDKKEERKFIKELKQRPDIEDFMNTYQWIDSSLDMYFESRSKNEKINEIDPIDQQALKDIDKYLINYSTKDSEKERIFREKLQWTMQHKERSSRINSGMVLNIAASVAFIVLIISAIIHFTDSRKDARFRNEIIASQFNPANDPFIKSLHSENTTGKDFQNGQQDINLILRSGNTTSKDILLVSISLMKEKDYSQAEYQLSGILNTSSSEISNAASWYLALCKIHLDDLEGAKILLQELCSGKSIYTDQACELKIKLDSTGSE